MTHTLYITGQDGSEARIEGDPALIGQLEAAIQKAGARWNPSVETWDFGFYDNTPRKRIKFSAADMRREERGR